MANTVTFVSLGPGEPELITLKGLQTLQKADFIFCPSTLLKDGSFSSRARDVLMALDIEESKIRLFDVPMSKDRTKALDSYAAVSDQIRSLYEQGLNLVVTAEGDSGFYSSSHYITDTLKKHDIEVTKIPGVPAFISAGALARIQIVEQEEQLHVVPGVIDSQELISKIQKGHTILIMKASQCKEVVSQIIGDCPHITIYYFENIGLDTEFYTTDKNIIAQRSFPYFSLLIIKP